MIFNTVLSNPLNFNVVRYATESELLAATPKENTIGIISTTEMTGWIIDANQPENLTDGMVWISAGTKSSVAFNALKKNSIRVYPVSAKQYVSRELVDKNSKIYQGGKWVELDDPNPILYNNGYLNSELTGDIITAACQEDSNRPGKAPNVAQNANDITITVSANLSAGIAYFENKIDLTSYNKLVFDGEMYAEWQWAGIYVWSAIGSLWNDYAVAYYNAGSGNSNPSLFDGEAVIDISSLTGEYYIGFAVQGSTGNVHITVRNLHLE